MILARWVTAIRRVSTEFNHHYNRLGNRCRLISVIVVQKNKIRCTPHLQPPPATDKIFGSYAVLRSIMLVMLIPIINRSNLYVLLHFSSERQMLRGI